MFRKAILTLLVLAAMTGFAYDSAMAAGAGAIALEFPIGARYNALGEAGTALSQDATSIWWNPGGLAFATDVYEHSVSVMHSKLVPDLADDIALYWGSYAGKLGTAGNFGVGLTYLDMGEQIATDESGIEQGTFESYMFALGAAYGTKITPNIGIGIGVKYYRDKLAENEFLQDQTGGSGSTFAVDAGVLWKVPTMRMNVGFAVSNLGPSIKHVDEQQSDPLPRRATLGLAYGVYSSPATSLIAVADYLVPLINWDGDEEIKDDPGFGPEFGDSEWGAGLEWSYVQSLFVRLGYKKGVGEIEDTTWGLGVDLNRWLGKNLTIGYASVPQSKDLDRVDRFSIDFKF